MLSIKAAQFVSNNNRPFNPNTTIEEYRRGVSQYITDADGTKEKLTSNSPGAALFANAEEKSSSQYFCANSKSVSFVEQIIRMDTTEIKVRIYSPRSEVGQFRPAIIYFTGSGFVYSNMEWQKRNCKSLAKKTGCIVINPQEHVAPEYKFPHGLNECFELTKWVISNGNEICVDGKKLNLCGFSSGGNFAAVIARRLSDAGLTVLSQCLISPWLDLTCSSESYNEFGKGYLLDKEVCSWLRNQYVANESDVKNPDVSPLLYNESLTGLPPALIIVGACDPFVDECQKYARRLERANILVRFQKVDGQIHEFAVCNRWNITEKGLDDPIEMAVYFFRSRIGLQPY